MMLEERKNKSEFRHRPPPTRLGALPRRLTCLNPCTRTHHHHLLSRTHHLQWIKEHNNNNIHNSILRINSMRSTERDGRCRGVVMYCDCGIGGDGLATAGDV